MKNLAVVIFVLIILTVLGMVFASFQVRETELAIITTFGQPKEPITEPGWYPRFPPPIQQVTKLDSRLRVLEAELGETATKGGAPIIVNTYVVWRIKDALKFYQKGWSEETIDEAQDMLLSQVNDARNNVIGQHHFGEFVNSDPAKIKFDQIEHEMREQLQAAVSDEYGVEIERVGIKHLKVSEDVTKAVFTRMKAERSRLTQATIAEGGAQALTIKTDAETKARELQATAEARARIIEGQADAEAAAHYAVLEKNSDLAMFLRDLEALEKFLQARSTIVISADKKPFSILGEIPSFGPVTAKDSDK
ncbi:MAG: SPFH domain-containing protein [Planctomycetota bacterium]|jgi:membrane protease subunit HflC